MFEHVLDITFQNLETVSIGGKRHYVTPQGNVYPSVTTVVGLHSEKSIQEWRNKVGEEQANKISSQAARRGNNLHRLCEHYLMNNLSLNGEMPTTIQLFKTIKPVIDENINRIYAVEAALYSDHLRVAGRIDCFAEFDGKPSVIDFKSSSKLKSEDHILGYFMQASAYSVMIEERTGIPVPRLVVIIAVENEAQPQIFVKKRNTYIDKFIEYRNLYDTIKGH